MEASPANIQKCVGVAIFDFSENGLTALKWAHDFIKLPVGYKLCIIRIRQVDGRSPREFPDGPPLDSFDKMESPFIKEAQDDMHRHRIIEFQTLAKDFCKAIFGKIYEGAHIQETLQYAINNLPGLETLIVGCAGANTAGSRTIPTAIELQLLYGCSIVMAKIRLAPSDPRIASETMPEAPTRDEDVPRCRSLMPAVAPVPAPPSGRSGSAGQY
ncbi:uncharacterized protein [Miscanthus floridulus]|uniref:uncharacterized protein n=1 Tax=Miscanthus floridulus TaxID=154761 RepID=UPI0034582128